MAEMARGIQMFDRGDRVEYDGGKTGIVEHDLGGAVVHLHPEGESWRYPHDAIPVDRESVELTRQVTDADGPQQIEIYSNGSTHTLYEFCGFDECRERILNLGLGIPRGDVFKRDRFLADADGEPVRITVRELDEPSTCIWCYGCGDFIQHGTDDGGCECEERGHDPEEDREALRPMIVENGRLELTPFN